MWWNFFGLIFPIVQLLAPGLKMTYFILKASEHFLKFNTSPEGGNLEDIKPSKDMTNIVKIPPSRRVPPTEGAWDTKEVCKNKGGQEALDNAMAWQLQCSKKEGVHSLDEGGLHSPTNWYVSHSQQRGRCLPSNYKPITMGGPNSIILAHYEIPQVPGSLKVNKGACYTLSTAIISPLWPQTKRQNRVIWFRVDK